MPIFEWLLQLTGLSQCALAQLFVFALWIPLGFGMLWMASIAHRRDPKCLEKCLRSLFDYCWQRTGLRIQKAMAKPTETAVATTLTGSELPKKKSMP